MGDLNYIKIRDKVFHLQVGDIITSNMEGRYIYQPSTSENLSQLPFRQYSRNTSIEITKKYHKAVENAENIELVAEIPSHSDNMPHLRQKEWRVIRSVREVLHEETVEKEEIYCILLTDDGYRYESEEIEKETPKQIKLKKYLGKKYLTVINKKYDFETITYEYGTFFVYCRFNDFDHFRDELYIKKKESLETALKNATESLNNFNTNMKSEGYEQ